MRRLTVVLLAALTAALFAVIPATAGSAHFVTLTATRTGDTLTVAGKEAGLGNLAQVHIVASATAACLNLGGNFPDAANKETVTAAGDFPVQNGHADFTLDLTAVFQPKCSPPMSVMFGDVTVTDTTNGVTQTLPGTF